MGWRPVENADEPTYKNCARCGFPVETDKTVSCPVCDNPDIIGYRKPSWAK